MGDMGGREGPRGSCPMETDRQICRGKGYEEQNDMGRDAGKTEGARWAFVCMNFVLYLIVWGGSSFEGDAAGWETGR